jgi:8-oxo-dGTP diphosphatase
MNDPLKQRIAFKGIVVNDAGKVLLLREASTYKEGTNIHRYGVPGGRLEPGEAWQDGLQREVMEETGLTVTIGEPLYVGEWRPVIRDVPHQIIAVFMLCRAGSSTVKLSDEHDAYEWVDMAAMTKLDVMKPDDEVIQLYFSRSK